MKLDLFQEVALKRDVPKHGLKAGDLATLVELVPHPTGGEEGCVLEIFNALGQSITIVTVPVSGVETLNANEVLTVRSLAPTA